MAAAIEAPSRAEFFSCVRAADPRVYITQYDKLEYYADKMYAPQVPEFVPKFVDFMRVPEAIREWSTTELFKVRPHFILFFFCLLSLYIRRTALRP